MACEDAYSKLLLLLMIVMKIVLARVCCRFGNWGLVIKLYFCSDFEYFGRDFEAEVWSVFCSWCLVEVTKLNLGQDSEAMFGQGFNFTFSRDADAWLRFWSWCLINRDSVIWTQPSGPLCLWQCFYCRHAFCLKINKKTKQISLVCLVCPGWTVCGISSIAKCVPKWHAWKVSLVIFARNLGSPSKTTKQIFSFPNQIQFDFEKSLAIANALNL